MNNFSEIINETRPVLVDFFATWCGPCKTQSSILTQLSEKCGDKIKIVKIDVDKNRELALSHHVQSTPTLILFSHGEPVWRKSGVQTLETILEVLWEHTSLHS